MFEGLVWLHEKPLLGLGMNSGMQGTRYQKIRFHFNNLIPVYKISGV